MHFEIYRTFAILKGRVWRWRLRAGNGEIIAHGEDYANKFDCRGAVNLIRAGAASALAEEVRL